MNPILQAATISFGNLNFGKSPIKKASQKIMNKYETLGCVGQGSYGSVFKCRNKDTGILVAIKKFTQSEDDPIIHKIAMREIRMLKNLKNPYLVNLIEVFKRKKHLHLVMEYVDHTLLDELEQNQKGMEKPQIRKIVWQILQAVDFCHKNNCIHRDIKPENILLTADGCVKLCDFGFARTITATAGPYTDYVATRWYRAPELLVGDIHYGFGVDIWSIGCVTAEMFRGQPLWAGNSDLSQLFLVTRTMGPLLRKHVEIFQSNDFFQGVTIPIPPDNETLTERMSCTKNTLTHREINFLEICLRMDPSQRWSCSKLMKHSYLDSFPSYDFLTVEDHGIRKRGIRMKTFSQPKNSCSLPSLSNNHASMQTQISTGAYLIVTPVTSKMSQIHFPHIS